ncbi:MAG: hypothetical protein QOJ12_1161 [Thermoleophilales bacterium]|nr:hypothetical protein [Thermoleophilales bacterium]
MTLGLALAAVAALAINSSYLVQHSALTGVVAVDARAPLTSLRRLLASPRWVAGAALGYAGLGVYGLALTLAPLSMVQSVAAAGQVVVAAGTRAVTGSRATAAEAAGTGLMVAALAALAIAPATQSHLAPALGGLIAFQATTAAVAMLVARTGALGLAAGLFYGGTTVSMASALAALHGTGTSTAVTIAALATGAAVTAGGFFCFQRALQTSRPVAAVASMTAGMTAGAIAGGVLVMHDGLGSGPARTALQLAALALVPVAALLASRGVSAQAEPAGGATRTAISPVPSQTGSVARGPAA